MKISILGRSEAAVQLSHALEDLDVDVVDARGEALEAARDAAADALVVACPLPERFSLAFEALSWGKHVVVAGTLRQPWEASALLARARARGRVLAIALPALLGEELARLARATAELENVRLVTARRAWDGRDWSEAWDGLADEVVRLHMLFGQAPEWVSTESSPAGREEEPAEAVSFTLGFPDERMAQIQLLVGARATSVVAHAATGPVRIDTAGFWTDDADGSGSEPSPAAIELATGFLESVGSGAVAPPGVPPAVFRCIEAAQKSLRDGCGEVRL